MATLTSSTSDRSLPTALALVLLAAGLLVAPVRVEATPANKAALGRHLGDFLPASLDSCATCHVRSHPDGAETLKDFPHNPFGKALAALGEDRPLGERVEAVAGTDSDGDNIANLDELLAGTKPGDPAAGERPAKETLAAFAKFQDRYRWRPFEPVTRPEVPDSGKDWSRSPIDAFLAAVHEDKGLSPRPAASKEIWLRRVHLDLTGLSPTPDERSSFLADDSPDAREKIVDRLLANPAHGERWARHWMDIWRYNDWSGYQGKVRRSQRHIWHWRDWIVESLNEDKGYDRMLTEMLAADEIAPEDPDTLRATGFILTNYEGNHNSRLDGIVTHMSQGLLGLTLGCAKCHDHMYDPLTMRDYYAMRAIFEPVRPRTDRVPGEMDVEKLGLPRAYDASTTIKTYLFERGDERYPVKDEAIPPAPPAVLGGEYQPGNVDLPYHAAYPDRRDFVKKELLAQREEQMEKASTDTEKEAARRRLEALRAEFALESMEASGEAKKSPEWAAKAKELVVLQRKADLLEAKCELEAGQQAKKKAETALTTAKKKEDKTAMSKASKAMSTAKKTMAEADKKLEAAEKAMEKEVTTKYRAREQNKFPDKSSGRRLAFAKWLTDRDNPLVARVAVNHVWARHFGQPLVPTVNEFGAHGTPPTHPALLDWLAAEFMARDWSFKWLHREIALSAAYAMASTPDPANAEIDPDNRWLWRMPSRRMEGEIVRDNLLHVAGTLDRELGGPDIPHGEAQTTKRRSLYYQHAHEALVEFVQIFDGAKVSECYLRDSTVQPHQALALANSPLTFDQSEVLAKKLASSTESEADFIEQAYLRVLAREPKSEERELCREFLQEGGDKTDLVMVLFNHSDFVTIR